MMLVQLHATPFDVNVIQIYAPTADKDDAVIEEFYEQLERLIKMTNKQEITIILGVCQAPQEISDSVKETKEETVLYSSARIITYYSVTSYSNSPLAEESTRGNRQQTLRKNS
ncbi:hypothetical protein HUJ04_011825 [Dendroctonus ponderosae]|nr:hypothetical protein HUJ04_011825 [Dendroctonus ponderosae]